MLQTKKAASSSLRNSIVPKSLLAPPLSWNLKVSPKHQVYIFGGIDFRHIHFPEPQPIAVLLPERFRGGCSFGADIKVPVSPTMV
jgi:hypothetical protein